MSPKPKQARRPMPAGARAIHCCSRPSPRSDGGQQTNDTGMSADGSAVTPMRGCWRGDHVPDLGGVMEFWTEPQMASIHKMLNPHSIAIVGATPRMQYGG